MEIGNIKEYPGYYITSCGKIWGYKSQIEAARQLNISQGHISAVLNGKRNVAGGFHFIHIDQEE